MGKWVDTQPPAVWACLPFARWPPQPAVWHGGNSGFPQGLALPPWTGQAETGHEPALRERRDCREPRQTWRKTLRQEENSYERNRESVFCLLNNIFIIWIVTVWSSVQVRPMVLKNQNKAHKIHLVHTFNYSLKYIVCMCCFTKGSTGFIYTIRSLRVGRHIFRKWNLVD